MDITIWDMDFYYKKSFVPNIDAMQLSSFHQQNGDSINFITEEIHLKLKFDLFYLIRRNKSTPRPSTRLLDDKRVRVLGEQMVGFDNYFVLNNVIASVRPDYMLYPKQEKNPYYNANMIRFYNLGKLIEVRQPFENTLKHHKKTIVTDLDFWEHSNENIIYCLKELSLYKNISFDSYINLFKILNSKEIYNLFINLDFSPGTVFKFKNNIGQNIKEAEILFDFINELKNKHNHVSFGRIPFKSVTKDHWDKENSIKNGLYDIIRCLQIIDLSKERKIKIRIIKTNRKNFESPFWYYLDNMEYWTEKLEEFSYIEYMLWSVMKRTGLSWYEILNNPIKWITPNTHFLLSLMVEKTEEIKKYGFRKWGQNFLDENLINWSTIAKYKGKLKDRIYIGGENG